MEDGIVRLAFGPEHCCGVIVSATHILTSKHQLNGAAEASVDDGTTPALYRGQVVDQHGTADLAVVAVASAKPAWASQAYSGGQQPPFGQPVKLAGVSAGAWSEQAICRQPTPGHQGRFSVDTQAVAKGWVPCIGDSGGPAWFDNSVVGVCSEPVAHAVGCVGDSMLYTFITPALASWIDQALAKPYKESVDEIPARLLTALFRDVRNGRLVADASANLGVSEATFLSWQAQYGHMSATQLNRARSLQDENTRLKLIVADLNLEVHVLTEALRQRAYR